jgi:hypothetical protein
MRYRSLAGRIMDFQWQPHEVPYKDQLKIDGQPVVFARNLLHQNPWVRQEVGGPLRIEHGGRRLSYDFKNWTRSESAVAAGAGG